MIPIELITNFQTAWKIIKFLNYEEYEWILHNSAYKIIEVIGEEHFERVRLLKQACTRYCDFKKLDLVFRKTYGKYKEYAIIDGEIFNGKKKICGGYKKGYSDKYRCEKNAGSQTFHKGYGFCKGHEMLLDSGQKKKMWLRLKEKGVLVDIEELLQRAEKINEFTTETMDVDLAYLEVSRQAIIDNARKVGGMSGRMSTDLAFISSESAKIKAMRDKLERSSWLPISKVISMIVQIIQEATKQEDDGVKKRIFQRVANMTNIVPQLDGGVKLEYNNDMKEAVKVASKYIKENTDWTDIKETTEYESDKPKRPKNYDHGYRVYPKETTDAKQ